MSSETIVNVAALEPIYKPHEEPTHHRVRAKTEGARAEIVKGRRPTAITIAQNLRRMVGEWRQCEYPGASDTTRGLLAYWFERSHLTVAKDGGQVPFRYYFCQREAIETLIFLYEVRSIRSLAGMTGEFGGALSDIAALGIDPDEDLWSKYAFKVATGAGKTKVMSLAIVWSYFHALRESDSPLARHFVVVAPNLTVFERLKEDFHPEGGGPDIFSKDPLIPPAWRGDWNFSVVLQDAASGAATGGILYLTNIHRLYDIGKRQKKREEETYSWMGPPVSKAKALDTGAALRERITAHERVMLLNDEAHHVWDPGSAWNEAITYLHHTINKRTGGGLISQLDFSATPKDNHGNIFKHVVCDTPLGEAVDAGIVKSPIIGRGHSLIEQPGEDASMRYQHHLMLGYTRWLKSKEEWEKSGKKALLFIMTEDTEAADQIAQRLNTDPFYGALNGKTINLHTRLKGSLKKEGRGTAAQMVFKESEKEISDDDLKELRKLSRDLDENTSPYLCIVSVLMLREGWDVRNVTTIVPLRAYTSKANILPEQTLGRGLRRMTPPGEALEVVSVVEHDAFTSLYVQELSQEGLPIEVVDVEQVPKTTVTIYPDAQNKDLIALDLLIPRLTPAHRIVSALGNITFDEVRKAFSRYKPLPLGQPRPTEVEYEGRHLFTNEVVEKMKVDLPLLQNGITAISFFRKALEFQTRCQNTQQVLAPLLQKFLEEVIFTEKVDLCDPRLCSRLADSDVQEHIRATFVPLILEKITRKETPIPRAEPISVTGWKPFQATHSERHPAIPAGKTPFNLVPCNRELEVAMTHFANQAPDVAAFCKNAGPQSLRIDYLTATGRLAFYTPDFLIRLTSGSYLLVETKGREDRDVPAKAKAAAAWCRAASSKKVKWDYLYVPQGVMGKLRSNRMEELARTCSPALADLIKEEDETQLPLPFGEAPDVSAADWASFVSSEDLASLPSRYRKAVEHAVTLYRFMEQKNGMSFAPAFTSLLGPLDEAARGFILELLLPDVPAASIEQANYFDPYYGKIPPRDIQWLKGQANNLKRTLIYRNGLMPLGLLSFCLAYGQEKSYPIGGVFTSVRERFSRFLDLEFHTLIEEIRDFRNTYVAHQQKDLMDREKAGGALKRWIGGLLQIYRLHQPLR
jgi:type III restriction enzyme